VKSRLALVLMSVVVLAACNPATRATSTEPLFERMSERDVQLANETLDRALETLPGGSAESWANASNGHAGSVRPVRTRFSTAKNVYCRDYEETLTIDGQTDRYADTACRDSQGQWIPIER